MYELSLNDNGMTFKDLEKKIYKYACSEACKALKEILEVLDEKLMNERDTKIYRNKRTQANLFANYYGRCRIFKTCL